MKISRRNFMKICAAGMGSSTLVAMGFSPTGLQASIRQFKLARTTETRSTCPYCSVSCGIIMYSLGSGAKNAHSSLIHIEGDDIRRVPEFLGDRSDKSCLGCERCVVICPGLAITLVDYRQDPDAPTVTLAYELAAGSLSPGDRVTAVDVEGDALGEADVTDVRAIPNNDRTVLVKLRVPTDRAKHLAGVRVQGPWASAPLPEALEPLTDEQIVCRCERVTAGEIRALIRRGYRDMNEIKAVTRAGMGACGGKTCSTLIKRLFREEGVPESRVTPFIQRPLFVEVPLALFAAAEVADDG